MNRMKRPRATHCALRDARRGNSIVEALVATSLVVVGIVGLVQLVARSMKANEQVTDRFIAAHLAAEGVEITRNYLEGFLAASSTSGGLSWEDLWTTLEDGAYEVSAADPDASSRRIGDQSRRSATPLAFEQNISPPYGYYPPPAIPTKFYRTVAVTWGPDCDPLPLVFRTAEVSIQSVVAWETRGVMSTTTVADKMWSWRGTPACSPPH